MYRQGDVMVRQATIPQSALIAEPSSQRVVLAYGAVTGHAHAIDVAEAREYIMAEAAGVVRRFLRVFEGGATLRHEEHDPILLPAGDYEIVQQREYTPEAIRNVAD